MDKTQAQRKRKSRSLTFRHLREQNVQRCNETWHPVNDWTPEEWMNCLVGEIGELAGLIKHTRRGETVPKGSIANELADIQIYLDLLAFRLGVELELAVS